MEHKIEVMEGMAREWRVRVMDSAGNVLNPSGFSFYGAAADGMQVPRRMQVRVEGDVVVLVLPGLWMSGRCWRYQVMCQDVLTGVEWLLCQGDVVLERRVACNGPALHEDAVLVDVVLDSEAAVLDVVLGDSTAATAEAARLAEAARAGAEAASERAAGDAARVEDLKRVTRAVAAGAALDAERAEDSKRGAEAAAGDAAADAQVAEGKAAEAEVSREAAEAAQRQAAAKAAEAEVSAKVAAEAVSDALGARDEAAAARGGAEDAMRAAGARAGEAEDSANAADESRAGAEAAQVKAEAAQAEAEAAKVKAEQEASKAEQNAALLGDAALKSGDNVFTGSNVFKGGFHVEDNPTISHFVDITGFHNDAETCYMAAEGWFGEVLAVKVDNVSGVQRAGQFFEKMKELFGVSTSLKKIYVFSDGAAFYNWIFYDALIACPNVKILVNRAENATVAAGDDWNIYGLKNVDYLEYHAPKTSLSLNGFSDINEIVKVLKIEAKNINAKGFPALKDNIVRVIRTSEQTDATRIFYSKDGALKVASVVEGFWDKIIKADSAFYGAKNLLSFSMYPQALPVLTQASNMFAGCELPADYVVNLMGTLPTYTSGTHELGLGIHVDHQADDEVLAAIDAATAKGWTLPVQWTGTATATTFALRPAPPMPVYAKVDTCTDDEGNEQRSLSWCHQVSSPDGKEPEELGYTMFESVEAAREYFGLAEEELTENI